MLIAIYMHIYFDGEVVVEEIGMDWMSKLNADSLTPWVLEWNTLSKAVQAEIRVILYKTGEFCS